MIYTMKSRRLLARPIRSLSRGTALLLLLASPPAFANLVTNGGFESNGGNGQLGFNTSAMDWSVSGSDYAFLYNPESGTTSGASADNSGAPGVFGTVWLWGPGNGSSNGLTLSPDGGAFIASNPAFRNGPITQTISGLTPGKETIVSFEYAGAQQFGFSGATSEGWAVSLGNSVGTQTHDTPEVSISSHGFSGWRTASLTFTPTSSTEVLSFLAIGTANEALPPFALLDGVSANPIPEVSTWVMMGLGFAGLGYVGFCSNRRKPVWCD